MKFSPAIIILSFLNLFLTIPGFGQDTLVTKTFLNNRVQLLVPKNFSELSQSKIEERYPDPGTRPTVILADKEKSGSIKIIRMPQVVSDNEVGQYKTFHVGNMKKEPNQKWLGDGLKIINGKTVGFIKVIHTDKNTFAYYFFTSLDNKILLLIYNCPDILWPSFEEIIEKIVNSLKVE